MRSVWAPAGAANSSGEAGRTCITVAQSRMHSAFPDS